MDSYLMDQESTSLNNYNNSFKNPLITPNTNSRKTENNNNNISSNILPLDPIIPTDNSPFLSPLAKINNKQQLNKNPTLISMYNQILNDNLSQTLDHNTQKENENIINQYFNLNSNPSLTGASTNQGLSIPENLNFISVEGNENDLSFPNMMNDNSLPLSSDQMSINEEDPLKNSLKNAYQRNSSTNEDINQLLFSDSFLTSISNNDEINLNNNDNTLENNNSEIKSRNVEISENNNNGNENNNIDNENENENNENENDIGGGGDDTDDDIENQNAFLDNLNLELEDSLYNQFEKTNNVDNNDMLLSSSPFNPNSFLNSDGNINVKNKINIYYNYNSLVTIQ